MIPASALRPARTARSLLVGAASLVLVMALIPVGANAATSVTIRIDSTLSPSVVTVAPGTRIVWLNRDGDRHRVRTTSGPGRFDSGNLEPGESWATTLTAEGIYGYADERNRENAAYQGRIVVSRTAGAGGASGGSGASGAATGGSTSGAAAASPPTTTSVAIGDGTFGPGTVTVAAGGSVTWRNGDDREHTATGRSAAFDTGSIAPGQSATERFPTAGTFAYLCVFHPDMLGTVRVVAPGVAAPPPAAPKPTSVPTAPPAAPAAIGAGAVDGAAPGGDPAIDPSGGGAATIKVVPDPSPSDPGPAGASVPASGTSAVDGGALGRAALTVLAIVIAMAFFGRLIRGVARR